MLSQLPCTGDPETVSNDSHSSNNLYWSVSIGSCSDDAWPFPAHGGQQVAQIPAVVEIPDQVQHLAGLASTSHHTQVDLQINTGLFQIPLYIRTERSQVLDL